MTYIQFVHKHCQVLPELVEIGGKKKQMVSAINVLLHAGKELLELKFSVAWSAF